MRAARSRSCSKACGSCSQPDTCRKGGKIAVLQFCKEPPDFMTPKLLVFVLCSIALVTLGQQSTTAPLATQAEKFKFGKSIYVRNDRGSTVAYDTIASDIQGWGRFLPAASP